jgi:RHS repeat-associated protein
VQTGSVPTFGVTGDLHDGAAGLVHLRARWYTTRAGTFTAVDPFAGFAAQPYSQHPYQYAYSNPVVWTDPSGQVSIVDDGGGGPRCIPIVERWDPVLQRCVPDLRPPPPNNRLTNDAARSYAQAFEDLVGAPAADAGGILTTDVAIPYPGITSEPRTRGGLDVGRLGAIIATLCLGSIADSLGRTESPQVPEPNWVVRGGVATAQQLQDGTGFHRAVLGLHGFSVQREPGKTIQELAAAGQFLNAQISVTTAEALSTAAATMGYTVDVVKSPGAGYHHTVAVPINQHVANNPHEPMPPELATALNQVFTQMLNPARVKRR